MNPITMKLRPESQVTFEYDLTNAPGHVNDPLTPSRTVRAERVTILLMPDTEGSWCVRMITVTGQPVVKGTVRESAIPRSVGWYLGDPDPEVRDTVPEWLWEIAEMHMNTMNPDLRKDRQMDAARKVTAEMFAGLLPGSTGANMANEVADKVLAAVLRVG